jgi:hypothetical protein
VEIHSWLPGGAAVIMHMRSPGHMYVPNWDAEATPEKQSTWVDVPSASRGWA